MLLMEDMTDEGRKETRHHSPLILEAGVHEEEVAVTSPEGAGVLRVVPQLGEAFFDALSHAAPL